MFKGRVIFILVILVFIAGANFAWRYVTSPPKQHLIEQSYYVCQKEKALVGGNFGTGPVIKFPDKKAWCWRWDWNRISREEFKSLTTKWYLKDWSDETYWWQN